MRATLFSVPELPAGKVSIMARPRGGDWLIDEVKALDDAHVDIVVSLLTTQEEKELDLLEEAECCRQRGIYFLRLPIVDRSVPAFSQQTFDFSEWVYSKLTEGKHVVLHCRQGLGRAALMAGALLVLAGFTADEACATLSKARGYEVPETQEQRAWLVAFAQQVSRRDEK
jgi:protein-tyrosine phosphatase